MIRLEEGALRIVKGIRVRAHVRSPMLLSFTTREIG